MNVAGVFAARRRVGFWLLPVLIAVGLAGCTTVPPSNVRSNAKLTPSTGITRDLTRLPKPRVRIPVAVYGFRDQTGQFKTSPDSAYSTLVTQGAASILVKALEDSGWYTPVEREGLQNLLTERRIVRAIESPTDKGKPIINLPNMLPASMIVEGGVLAYEANVRTGGKGANYLGIGASTQYRVDQVTVGLRSVDVRTGQVLNSVSVTKTIYSYQFSANIYKFTSFQHLLQAETGYSTNEPAQLAVREAIEAAVVHLTVSGIRDRYFELQDASTWSNSVIQSYLAEGLGNVSDEPVADEALIPMRPRSPDGAALQSMFAAAADDGPLLREPVPTAGDKPQSARPAPVSAPNPAAVPMAVPLATPMPLSVPSQAAPPVPSEVRKNAAPAPPAKLKLPAPASAVVLPAAPVLAAVRAATPKPSAVPAPASPLAAAQERLSATALSPLVPLPTAAAPAASAAQPRQAGLNEDIFNRYWNAR